MATSSITKNFVISGQEQVEMFIAALEASEREMDSNQYKPVGFREITDEDEIITRLEKRKRSRVNGTK